MLVTGIIAEYNPFHKGHAYHLARARELTGADYLVVVMSGNFVQRGAPAIVDKYCRTRMALSEGADLVLELPSAYACASAEGFAGGAVSLLNGLGCVTGLCFGSECGDLSRLKSCAQVLTEEPPGYQELLRAFLKQGCSFPLARSKALQEYESYTQDILPCSREDSVCRYESELLSQPNNTLGIEYLKALSLSKSTIQPCTIRRTSAGYHDASLDKAFPSATALRGVLCDQGSAAIREKLPQKAGTILNEYLETGQILTWDDFSSILHYQILSASEEELSAFTDLSPELAARIKNLQNEYRSAASFADLIKTRQLTHTRVTRALCHILLKDRQADAIRRKELGYPVYGRILGFRRDSQPLLAAVRESADIPLIGRMADAGELLSSAKNGPELLSLFRQDVFASHVYESVFAQKSGRAFCHEYTRPVILLP